MSHQLDSISLQGHAPKMRPHKDSINSPFASLLQICSSSFCVPLPNMFIKSQYVGKRDSSVGNMPSEQAWIWIPKHPYRKLIMLAFAY